MNQKNKSIRGIRRENSNTVKILRGIRTLFELDEEDYYKPIRTGNAFSTNYIEYESNGVKTKCYQLKIIFIKLNHIETNWVKSFKIW